MRAVTGIRSFLRALRKSWRRPVSLMVVPYGPLPAWRLRFSVPFLLFMAALWTGITLWAGYVAGRNLDYYVTKADNRVLSARVAYVSGEMERGRKYIELTRKTDEQMRHMLGMGSRNAIIRDDGDNGGEGGAPSSDANSLRRALEKKAAWISDSVFRNGMRQVTEQSQRALAGFQEIAWYITNQRSMYRATPAIWPAPGAVTSPFGYRMSPFESDYGEFHPGVDISNRPDTPIRATADGVVRHAGWAAGYGQAVLLDHGFAYSTLYGHAAKLEVKEGQQVKRGQIIARMGTTGRSTGSHVHYEVWQSGKPVNPVKYMTAVADKPARED
ncbi:MAG: M23 family metallopeptidase [Elusimicrobiales bacterium]